MNDHQQAQFNLTLATVLSSSNSSKLAAAAESDRLNAEHVGIVKSIASQAQKAADDARAENERYASQAQKAADDARAENERYRALLARPLIDVLQENTDLKKAYEEQQKLLKRWVVSQEAFRSLAHKFRKELGISDDKIKELIKEEYSRGPEILKSKGM